ncbi:MAG: isochorismatase family cysteine hydrolase [Thermodesulfobacteriota bacterium]
MSRDMKNLETPYTVLSRDHAALLVIDTQNDFGDLKGAKCMPDAQTVVPQVSRAVELFRKVGKPVIHVVRLYRPDGKNVDPCRRWQVEKEGLRVVVPGTWGAEPCAGTVPAGVRLDTETLLSGKVQTIGENEFIIYKPRFSAFHGTDLADLLRERGVDTVVIVGITFGNCVRASQFGATDNDFRVGMVPEAVTMTFPEGMAAMQSEGVQLLDLEQLASWLAGKTGE